MKRICLSRVICLAVLVLIAGSLDSLAWDKPYVGRMDIHVTDYEDTFIDLARNNNLGFVELRAANPGVDPWLPGEDVELILPTRHLLPDAPKEGVVINLPEMRLYFYPEDGGKPESYPIGIGREGLQTPLGTTKIRAKKEGPTWRPTARMRREDPELPASVPPGPDNPLGTHMLYLAWPAYGIHGTNKPYGIGRRVSSGCIRLYPEGIEELYPKVDVDTKVTVVDQPLKLAWIKDTLYLEAHPTMSQADIMEESGGLPSYEVAESELKTIMQAAGSHHYAIDWPRVRKLLSDRNGYPVPIARRNEES